MVLVYHMFQTGEYIREEVIQTPVTVKESQRVQERKEETAVEATLAPGVLRTAQEIIGRLQEPNTVMKDKIEQLLAQIGIAPCMYQGGVSTV